jgi:predicted Holliday junction resolvase-like endonuclease
MDRVETETERLETSEERLNGIEHGLREKAREKGRRLAHRAIKRIDPVFGPRNLNADDAKVLFHPVDFVVFKGLNSQSRIKELIFLDRESNSTEARRLQRSIEKTIEQGKYEWLTIRVSDDGKIVEES